MFLLAFLLSALYNAFKRKGITVISASATPTQSLSTNSRKKFGQMLTKLSCGTAENCPKYIGSIWDIDQGSPADRIRNALRDANVIWRSSTWSEEWRFLAFVAATKKLWSRDVLLRNLFATNAEAYMILLLQLALTIPEMSGQTGLWIETPWLGRQVVTPWKLSSMFSIRNTRDFVEERENSPHVYLLFLALSPLLGSFVTQK